MLKKFLPHRQAGIWKKIGFWIATVSIGLIALGTIVAAATVAILSIGLPDVTDLETLSADQSTQIFDRNDKLLYTIHGEENREQVELKNIAPSLVSATVAIEDDSFWEHGGFDILALGKVALYEVLGIGSPRGGSTITQQYVKNTFLSAERTYTRKAKELILALRMERSFDKEKIIELYLNRIPYGNNAYGIQKASEIYFDKDAKDLTLGESAILASLPQAPSRYNPYGNNKYSHLLKEFTADELKYRKIQSEFDLETHEYARGLIGKHIDLGNGESIYVAGRSDVALKRMFELEMITQEERQTALNEIQQITFNVYRESINHPHFVLYIKQLLEDKYGKDVVERGGLKVYTTLDGELQEYAETVATEKGEVNITKYGANNLAILSVNAKTGEILTMVGSRDYFNEEIDGNVNVALRPRQPGSSFKPIVYAQAFYNGYSPGNVIYDIPTKIGPDKPQNYDGKWQGQISVRRALAQSRNIPAIKAYFLAGEQDPIIDLATKMGITTLNKSHSYGYPLALGAGEVPLVEMVTAFSVFANNGKKPELTSILRVENANGDILEEWKQKQKDFEEVLDPQIAYLINSILSDQDQAVGPRLFINGQVNAAKTGTSTKENKKEAGGSAVRPSDGWTIGYTPTIVTGVWIGNTDGSGLGYNANGYDSASQIFNAVMTKALEGKAAEPFPEPEGIKHVKVSKSSGKLPGPQTPGAYVVTEIFPSFSIPEEVENLFTKVTLDKISGLLATTFTPESSKEEVTFQNYEPIADMLNWKAEIRQFYANATSGGEDGEGGVRVGLPPIEYDNVHTAEAAAQGPSINIINPVPQSALDYGLTPIKIATTSIHGIDHVEVYIDDDMVYTTSSFPYDSTVYIPNSFAAGSKHLIVTKVIDALGYSSESAIEIKVGPPETPSPEPEESKEEIPILPQSQ